MVDVDPILARLAAITPGTWRRHGGDIYAGSDQTTALLRGRVGTAKVRAQTEADAEFVAHAAADIAALLDKLAHTQEGGMPLQMGGEAEVALTPQANRRRRRRQAERDRRTVTNWLRRLPRQ